MNMKLRIIAFPLTQNEPLYQSREHVLFYGVCHVAPPCLYSSPERTYQNLALDLTYNVTADATEFYTLNH